MAETQEPLWRELYRTAMVELDPAKLRTAIAEARAAIQRHRDELAGCDPGASTAEAGVAEVRQALADALENLRALERVEFKSSPIPAQLASPPCPEGLS